MSNAPGTIWATCSAHENWDDLNASAYKVDWWQEYRRADLPATDEQIAADPKVRALVEALRLAEELYEVGVLNAPNGLFEKVLSSRRAALAEFTTTTTTKET